jgi:hypothetical protein
MLQDSLSARSLRDCLRHPSAHWCRSRTGKRHARRPECLPPGMPFADRFAGGGSLRSRPWLVFARPSPPESISGGTSPANDSFSGGRYAAPVIDSPYPGGVSLSPFPFPLSSERGQRRVAPEYEHRNLPGVFVSKDRGAAESCTRCRRLRRECRMVRAPLPGAGEVSICQATLKLTPLGDTKTDPLLYA